LLAAVAAIAVAVTWINIYRLAERNRSLEAEIRRLRNEVGELAIVDESRFHAIRVATDNELEWKWRIWIPERRRYQLRVVYDHIPKEGFPQGGSTSMLFEPGEHTVRYLIQRDPRDNRWHGTLFTADGYLSGHNHPWVDWKRTSTTVGVDKSTENFAPDERVELARHRVSQATSLDKIEDPAAGFLIWLEPN
jgi:hypothetical protein